MDIMNDIYDARELLEENLHDLIDHVKKDCDGDLLDHDGELCAMKMILSGLAKASEIEAMEEQKGGSNGSQRGRPPGYAYGGGMRANGNGGNGGSQAQRRNMRTGRYMDGANDLRQEFQEKINNIPDMQTRMDMQRMMDAMSNR